MRWLITGLIEQCKDHIIAPVYYVIDCLIDTLFHCHNKVTILEIFVDEDKLVNIAHFAATTRWKFWCSLHMGSRLGLSTTTRLSNLLKKMISIFNINDFFCVINLVRNLAMKIYSFSTFCQLQY